jgi:aminoglycoside/choline kinase family phosphotransferase
MPTLEDRLVKLARDAAQSSATFQVTKLAGQASSRMYYRIAGPQSSYVAMVLPPDATKSDEATSGSAPTELPFLNVHRYLARAGVPVPVVHTVALDQGVLLLEDLGDTTLELALKVRSPHELYGNAIDVLADLRAKAEAHPDESCIAFGRSFDRALYRWELEHYLEYGLTARTGSAPTAAEAAVLSKAFDSIADTLAALPRGFTHRDYQSRNLMMAPRGLVVIDFQDALLGPRQYDLVALLRDSYVELSDDVIDEMLARYLERFRAQSKSGSGLDEAAFRKTFDLLTVQRKLKDGGRFEFISRVKGNPDFLPHVPASFGYVARALERLPEYGELLTVLRNRHPELTKN